MRWVIVLCVVACSSKSAPQQMKVNVPPPAKQQGTGYEPDGRALRMPRVFVPTRYTATLSIDPSKPTFRGRIEIVGELERDSNAIWLNALGLDIKRWSVSGASGQEMMQAHPDAGRIELRASGGFRQGQTTIRIDYEGQVAQRGIRGVFRSEHQGVPYVFSYFEPVHARRAFPSIDEPDRKTPWQLTIESPAGSVAVSNTEAIETTQLPDGSTRTKFAETPPLPSYLIAFGVGPFDIVDAGKSKGGVPLRVVAPRGTSGQVKFVANAVPRIVDFFVDFFGVAYPYSKLDVLVTPALGGFAMEHAGLVTIDSIWVAFERAPSFQRRRDCVAIVGHEIAHMWLGDLVTPSWWDDTWLKESFATWTEHKVTAAFDPSWRDGAGVISRRTGAFGVDSQAAARQVRQPITKADEIGTTFDAVTYIKGASVLEMFERYVGAEAFRRGLRGYLTKHAHGNATLDDFVAALEKETPKKIARALSTFLAQPGLPALDARVACDGKPRVVIDQHRHLRVGSAPPTKTAPWHIPVCVAYEHGGKRAETCALVEGRGEIELPACPQWTMLNAGGVGYYYVALAEADAIALRDKAWTLLTPEERRVVFEDVRGQVANGKLPMKLLMSFVPKLVAAGDRFSVSDALGRPFTGFLDQGVAGDGVPWLLSASVPDDDLPALAAWVRKQFGTLARKRGFLPQAADTFDDEVTRGILVRIVGNAGDPQLSKQAVTLAKRYRELPPTARDLVLPLAVVADPKVVEQVKRDVLVESDHAMKLAQLVALTELDDPKRVDAALSVMLDPKVPAESVMLGTIFHSKPRRAEREFDRWLRTNIAALLARFPSGAGSMAMHLANGFWTCDATQRDATVQLMQSQFAKVDGGPKIVRERIEQIDQCIAQRALVAPSIREWLRTAR